MALKATIYKADLQIADMDRHYYADHQLTLAQHPSETIERLMVRVVAFARFADEQLSFTKDLFETDEPALWQKDLTGQLEKWIEVGHPDESKIKKASARCPEVAIITYGHQVDDWWNRNSKIKNMGNVSVWKLSQATTQGIQELCARTMQLQLNIIDGEWTLSSDKGSIAIEWTVLK